jgi:peptidoglycan/xylan/chitin deacetylase (PgdA/CDA1 family)
MSHLTGKTPLRHGARYALAAILFSFLTVAAMAQQIAITIDDVPEHGSLPKGVTRIEVAAQTIAALKAAKVPPVYGMVNANWLDYDQVQAAAVLKLWRDSGFLLANHTYTHINLNQHTVAEFEADLQRNEPAIASRMTGEDWHWLRYPFLAEGDTPQKQAEVRKFLAAHGYKIAAVTMGFGDYLYNDAYARCSDKGDTKAVAALENDYLAAAAANADRLHLLSQNLYQRDVPYVLLMHISAFNARMWPRLLDLYKSKGFSFISLADAEKDSFYKSAMDPSLPYEWVSLEGQSWQHGKTVPPDYKHAVDLDGICK